MLRRHPWLSWLPFLLCLPVLVLLIEQGLFLATGPVSIALQVAGIALNLWARFTFRARSFHAGAATTEGALVTKGPYGFVRHPVYASLLLVMTGSLVAHPTPLAFGAIAFLAAATFTRIFLEERLLRETYPDYAAYALRVKRIVPAVW